MKRHVIFGESYLGVMRFCPDCGKKRRVTWRSQPDIGTVYISGDRDERFEEELSCGHTLDTFIYVGGDIRSYVLLAQNK
jgi:hypothetical protein